MQPKKNKGKERTKNYLRSQHPSPQQTTSKDVDIDELLARNMQHATLNSLATDFVHQTSNFSPSQLSYYDDQTVVVSSSDGGLPDSPHDSSDDFELAPPPEGGFRGNSCRRFKVYIVYRGRIPGIYMDW
ncbi:hypothetical protein H0H92_002430 [Tricholoma furcatifolium]|nr:hypothetical protein H0H92_002430 [Tricholoma furcatifolium]